MRVIEIGKKQIADGAPCFLIAEAGVNHNGDLNLARQLIDAAAAAGADAVKFQTFRAEKLASREAPKAAYQLKTTDAEQSQFEMLQRLELDRSMHLELIEHCRKAGIEFLSTPFDETCAHLLIDLGLPALKLPSGELTNLPFLAYVAGLGKPLIISTGMATLGEVETAVETVRQNGSPPVVLLHCVSNYPAAARDVNLHAMSTLARAFGLPVGYSDHTLGCEISFAAVALGARVLEKHFTLSRTLPGPDHQASMEPRELCAWVKGVRTVEQSLGHGRKEPAASESNTRAVARKSMVAARSIAVGTVLTREMITMKRPGTGLPPAMLPYVIGRTLRAPLGADALITTDVLQ